MATTLTPSVAPAPKPPRRPTSPDGILIVDKPQGITSHDVVARLRRLCGTRAVGHGGTLDPMATGVLICGIGKGTKLLTYVSGSDKAYSATIRLGIATTTDDAEGEILSAPGARLVVSTDATASLLNRPNATHSSSCASSLGAQTQDLTVEAIKSAVAELIGDIQQVPTSVSAIKVDGKRAYDLVRNGEEVALAARPVTVSEFQVTDIRQTTTPDRVPVIDLDVEVVVSSGTYVRALARDLGQALGTGGHLTRLRRTRIGNVGIEQAQTLDELERVGAELNEAHLPLQTMPLAAAPTLFLPCRQVTDAEATDLRQGKFIAIQQTDTASAAIGPTGDLVAIIEPANASKAKPKVVFPWVQ